MQFLTLLLHQFTLGRTAMSCKELRRAGVLARVKSGELTLVDAAVLMGMSYRQSTLPFLPSTWAPKCE